MKSKWIIQGLDGYVFGEDKKLYRLPRKIGNRYYGLKQVKKQYPNRYYINGQMLSERQMEHRIIIDPNPIVLFDKKNTPF